MKRILIFSLAYYPHVGGAEVASKELTDRITDVEFHMITMRFSAAEKREEKIGNVFVHRVGKGSSYLSKILFVPRAALAARALHKEFHFDAFWAMMSYMTFPVVLLRMLGTRIPYVLTLQDGDPFAHVFRRWYILPFIPLLRWGFAHASRVTALSTYLAEWAKHLGYIDTVTLIPNGADITHFANAVPTDVHKKEGDVWLVHTGRMVHKNGIDTIIRALPLLPSSVHFLQVGSGVEGHTLHCLAEKIKVADRVHFIEYVSHAELPGYLHASDIFIRPSRTEGFGASFPEAMVAGLPVIATQEGGIADFLFDAKRNPDQETTGWAVDKDSPDQIAEAVKDIIAHTDEVRRVTENAKRMVAEKYDWNLIARRVQTLFATLGV